MPLSNPMYIDANARHRASQIRTLDYIAVEGQEGVLQSDHLRITQLGTAGAGITGLPGAYSVLARHSGGAFEAYIGKVASSLEFGNNGDGVIPVSPVGSGGARTDLVILRIENPYVVGSGTWAPVDEVDGPYARIWVQEGVPTNINHVSQHNNTWSAITLAKITRPANTGIVTQAHITDLRSLARIGGSRIVVIENPPAIPPPIAQTYWAESTHCPSVTNLPINNTLTAWPGEALWQVPIPSWATEMTIDVRINNFQMNTGDQTGDARLLVDGVGTPLASWDLNFVKTGTGPLFNPLRASIFIGGKYAVPSNIRGRVVPIRTQVRAFGGTGVDGVLRTINGTYVNAFLNFERNPN